MEAPPVPQQPSLVEEQRLWVQGCLCVAGLDEAGRGAWVGPVVAAAVVLPPDARADGLLGSVRDSKLLSSRQRERCYEQIVRFALAYGIGASSARVIDQLGIVPATRQAMEQALGALAVHPEFLLIDALQLDRNTPQKALIKGDRTCLSIAAASILAKVTRDRWLVALDELLPGYGLARHKGYGTPQHQEALARLGPTALHRHSFAPIRALDEEHYV